MKTQPKPPTSSAAGRARVQMDFLYASNFQFRTLVKCPPGQRSTPPGSFVVENEVPLNADWFHASEYSHLPFFLPLLNPRSYLRTRHKFAASFRFGIHVLPAAPALYVLKHIA